MTTTKSLPFAAPYTSTTFKQNQSLLVGVSGVITGGEVTTVGGIAMIQPLSFIQNGQIISTDYVCSATVPGGLTAPFSIALTSSNDRQTLTDVLTPTFVQRPQDISSGTVLIADWDGSEWISRPKLQVAERVLSEQTRALTQDNVGIADGFDVTKSGSDLVVSAGSLTDRQGGLVTKTAQSVFTPVAADAKYDRVDQVVYRKPDDSVVRGGSIQYLVGHTFAPDNTAYPVDVVDLGSVDVVSKAGKVLIDPVGNNRIFLFTQDYGDRAKLVMTARNDLGSEVIAPQVIATEIGEFDAIVNPDLTIDILFTRGEAILYSRINLDGTVIYAEKTVATHYQAVSRPRLITVKSGSTYFIQAVYVLAVSTLDHQIYYTRLSAANTIETAPLPLIQLNTVLTNPSLDKDDDDSLMFLAYENTSTGKVYLRQYDVSTVTAISAPSIYGPTLELQDDTYQISQATVLPSSGATGPVVKRAANKDTFVFWIHPKGTGHAVAIYSARYAAAFGHKAIAVDLIVPAEDIQQFGVAVDLIGGAHFCAVTDRGTYKVSKYLDDATSIGTADILDPRLGATGSAISFDQVGALVHFWSYPSAGTQLNGSALPVLFVGPGSYASAAVAANEFVVASSDYSGLAVPPTAPESVTLGGSEPLNGTYGFLSVRQVSASGVTYTVVATDGTFAAEAGAITAQFYTQTAMQARSAKSAAGVGTNLRGFRVLRTDVFIASYRTSDGVLAVSGPAIEESLTLTRLYEFLSCFPGGGGTTSWKTAGTDILTFDGSININFFNRRATYQIAAVPGGITIHTGQVAYVEIPDSDVSAALTLKVTDYGSGILDRHGRTIYPLFWNTSGILYTRFAPFRLNTGETIIMGDQISQQMLSWLGAPNSSPDATNHGYASTSIIAQGDSPIAALSKLDLTLNSYSASSIAIPAGASTATVMFPTEKASASYTALVSMTNLVDQTPMFQPLTVTAKTTASMTVKWNSPVDTGNYRLEYVVNSA